MRENQHVTDTTDTQETDTAGFNHLSPDECMEILGNNQFGRLAVSVGGRPDIFPVNFIVYEGNVVFRTAEGSKLASLAINSHVAFEVDGYDGDTNNAWSVVLHGQAKLIHHGPDEEHLESLPLFPWNMAPKHHLVEIDPHEISGRRFVAEGRHD